MLEIEHVHQVSDGRAVGRDIRVCTILFWIRHVVPAAADAANNLRCEAMSVENGLPTATTNIDGGKLGG